MNREEVIEIARKAGFHVSDKDQCLPEYKRFAAEVERRTLERAAKVCEDDFGNGALNLAAAIRALGEK